MLTKVVLWVLAVSAAVCLFQKLAAPKMEGGAAPAPASPPPRELKLLRAGYTTDRTLWRQIARSQARGRVPAKHHPLLIGRHGPSERPSSLSPEEAREAAAKRAEALRASGVEPPVAEGADFVVLDETVAPGAIVARDGSVRFNAADTAHPCGFNNVGCL